MTRAKNQCTIKKETLQAAISKGVQAALKEMNLDNRIADAMAISQTGENEMAKRIKVRVDVDGAARWVTGETQQEVILSAAKLIANSGTITGGYKLGRQVPTFDECAWQWFNVYKIPKVKQNTAYGYKQDMINHVLPAFAGKPIDEIKPTDIQIFLNSKKDKAKSTVKHIWLILHGILSMAVWDGYIEKDPTADASKYTMSKRKSKRESLSTEAVQDIIANLDRLEGNDLRLLSLLIYTGMRRSEVLGLRWEDIDFQRGLIHVDRAVTFKNNQPVIGDTKSEAGKRYIPLEAQLKAILAPMRQENGFVIGQDSPITEMTYKRMWERIGKKIDLHGATAHVFRHTYITKAASRVDIKTLQSIAGHADISTTMNRYAHGREEKIMEAGKNLAGMYM